MGMFIINLLKNVSTVANIWNALYEQKMQMSPQTFSLLPYTWHLSTYRQLSLWGDIDTLALSVQTGQNLGHWIRRVLLFCFPMTLDSCAEDSSKPLLFNRSIREHG